MVLTAITVTVAFINLGALNFPVALGIAILKATLVILFFMHVKYSSRLTKLICGMRFFFLLILFGLTLSDYLSRGWFVAPGGTAAAGTRVTIGPPAPVTEPAEPTEPGTEQQPTTRALNRRVIRRSDTASLARSSTCK